MVVLQENEIVDEAARLSVFRTSYDTTHENLKKVLEKYEKLLSSYRTLKSDFEEEKEAREKYKRLARGQERHPFVLVLIDGDGYVFHDQLVRAEADGGARAAQLLREAVTAHLSNEDRNCAIVCRVYADLARLSSRLAIANIGKPHSRASGPFAAAFTRSQQHFDYIDCGDNVDNAPDKIIDSLRLNAGPGQCKKIFLACAHRDRYVEPLTAMLNKYPERREQLVLIRPPGYNAEYDFLHVPIVEFPAVFRPAPLAPAQPFVKARYGEAANFTKDQPRHGNDLSRYASHDSGASMSRDHNEPSRYANPASVSKWGKVVASSTPTPLPYRNFSSPDTPTVRSMTPATELLPSSSGSFRDQIPVNRDGCRIDATIPPPPFETIKHYNARSKPVRPCNDFHLRDNCPKGPGCPYDHGPCDDTCLNVMKYYLRHVVCPRGSDCRDLTCLKGHHCQHFSCVNDRKSLKCKFKQSMHLQDLKIYEWISPDKEPTFDTETMIDVNDDLWDRSSVRDVANLRDLSSPLDAPVEMSKPWANDLVSIDGPNLWTPLSAQPSYFNGRNSLEASPVDNKAHSNGHDGREFESANGELTNGQMDRSHEAFAESKANNGENGSWERPHSNGDNSSWDPPHSSGENDLWDPPHDPDESDSWDIPQPSGPSASWDIPSTDGDNAPWEPSNSNGGTEHEEPGQQTRRSWPENDDLMNESRPETPKQSGGAWNNIVVEGFETTDNTRSWNNHSRPSNSHGWRGHDRNDRSADDDASVNSFLGSPIRHAREPVNGNANDYN